MENNLENKIKFFAQYILQNVAKETKYPDSPTIRPITVFRIGFDYVSFYHLELKSIEEISDSDMELIFSIDGQHPTKTAVDFLMENLSSYNAFDVSIIIDNIRANGYAWPYGGLTVKELIDYGWVKLKNDES